MEVHMTRFVVNTRPDDWYVVHDSYTDMPVCAWTDEREAAVQCRALNEMHVDEDEVLGDVLDVIRNERG
jgi:hypothetical protein